MTRFPLLAAIVPLIANLNPCGSEAPPAPPSAPVAIAPASAAPVAATATFRAKHGGTIVAAGSFSLEVLAKSDGSIRAYPVQGETGQTPPPPVPETAEVVVTVPTASGTATAVPLTWTAGADASFEGHLTGNVVRPGPCRVGIANAGAGSVSVEGSIPEITIAPVAARGGTLVDVGAAKLEVVVASSGTVQAYPIYPTVASLEVVPPATTITVDVATQAGPPATVPLTWQGPIATFEGHADATFVPGALAVHCVHGASRFDATAPTFVVKPPSALVVTGPQHGGMVVDIEGGHQLEVVVVDDGHVEAYPVATYVGSPAVEADVNVNIDVPVVTGPPQSVSLVWNADAAFFGGVVTNATVKQGPVGVVLIDGPRHYRQRSAVIIVPARPVVRARVVAPAPPNVRANAGAGVGVRAGVGAGIGGALRGGVRVQVNVPPPPSVRVQVGGSLRVH